MRTTILSLAFCVASVLSAAAQPAPTSCPHPAAKSVPPSAAVLAARRTEREVCAGDMAKLCANVPRGCGRPMQCLRAHASQLSGSCAGAMAQLRAARTQSQAPSPATQH